MVLYKFVIKETISVVFPLGCWAWDFPCSRPTSFLTERPKASYASESTPVLSTTSGTECCHLVSKV